MMITEQYPLLTDSWSGMSAEDRANVIRSIRNALLIQCDWTQLSDAPLSEGKKTEWATYRQELRDILETYSENLLDLEFPVSPDQTA